MYVLARYYGMQVEKSHQTQDEQSCVVIDIEDQEDQLKEAAEEGTTEIDGKDDSPPVVPKLLFLSDTNEDGESAETDVEPTVSYTGSVKILLFLVYILFNNMYTYYGWIENE